MHLCAERKKDTPDDCLFDSATPKKTGLTQFKLNFSLIITKGKERERKKKEEIAGAQLIVKDEEKV